MGKTTIHFGSKVFQQLQTSEEACLFQKPQPPPPHKKKKPALNLDSVFGDCPIQMDKNLQNKEN
jgi:hypothetical protein